MAIQSFRIEVCAGACWTGLLLPQLPVVTTLAFECCQSCQSQQLDFPGYHGRCLFEKYDLISFLQYNIIKRFAMLDQLLIWLFSADRGIRFIEQWWRYVLDRHNEIRYYIVERYCHMCIFMLPTCMGWKHHVNIMQFWMDFVSFCVGQSFEFLYPIQVFNGSSF